MHASAVFFIIFLNIFFSISFHMLRFFVLLSLGVLLCRSFLRYVCGSTTKTTTTPTAHTHTCVHGIWTNEKYKKKTHMKHTVETDSEQSYYELNTVILNRSNDSPTSRVVDGCVVYKTSDDNFPDHSKIIAHTNDTVSYTLAESRQLTAIEVVTSKEGENIIASTTAATLSSSTTSPSLQYTLSTAAESSSKSASANNNNKNLSASEMVMQHHQHHHHIQPMIETEHYHHPNSPIAVSSDPTLMRSSLIYMYTPYSSPPSPPNQHNHPHHHPAQQHHQIVHHSNVISSATTIDEVIADTLKDENCTMIESLNHSPVLVQSVNYSGNSHSTANSDDGHDHNSKSPIAGTAALSHSDEYDGHTLQSFTHLTNATDSGHSLVSREGIYSTALLTPNSVTASSSIIHPIQTYEGGVLHPATPTR